MESVRRTVSVVDFPDLELALETESWKESVGKTVIVVDVLRATSTIVEALSNGAESVWPAESTDMARALLRRLDSNGHTTLLAGERGGLKIDGFDCGNSPLQFERENVQHASIVLTTTNGTRAVAISRTASTVLAGSLLNARAVAKRAWATERDIVLLCAGSNGIRSGEDRIGAGAIVAELRDRHGFGCEYSEDALFAQEQFDNAADDLKSALSSTEHGRRLLELGCANDIEFCARLNVRPNVVPMLFDGERFERASAKYTR